MPVTNHVGWTRRYLPTAGPPSPERRSRAGDSIPPAATTTASASTVSSVLLPSGPDTVATTPADPTVPDEDPLGAAVDDDARARIGGVLQVRLERRLLAALLAALVAVAAETGIVVG